MQKEKLVGKRVCLAKDMRLDEETILHKGSTGKVCSETPNKHFLSVAFDGTECLRLDEFNGFVYCMMSELYFPDSKLGYNQQCFNQKKQHDPKIPIRHSSILAETFGPQEN